MIHMLLGLETQSRTEQNNLENVFQENGKNSSFLKHVVTLFNAAVCFSAARLSSISVLISRHIKGQT